MEEKNKSEKTQNIQQKKKKVIKKRSKTDKYFDFYDDIKSGCHKKVDW